MSQKVSLTAVFVLLFAFFLTAQKVPMKWGKIPKEDLQMTVYEPDNSANAVVLGDYGSLTFDFQGDNYSYILKRHRRIKILNRAGFRQGDISIPFYNFNKQGDLSAIKVQVFAPDGSSKKLSNKDIFEEQVDDFYAKKKFTIPNLQEGSIIEYQYTLQQEHLLELEQWYFQDEIPVRWSEYRLLIPEWYTYLMLVSGRELDVQEKERRKRSVTFEDHHAHGNGVGTFQAGTQQIDVDMQLHRLIMKDIPALKSENYMTTINDHLANVQFQLQMVEYPGQAARKVLSNWDIVARDLLDSEQLGRKYTKKINYFTLLKEAQAKVPKGENQRATAIALNQFLLENVQWNKTYTTGSNVMLNEVFRKKTGSSGQLNLMMLALLNEYDIPAYPLLTSTRSHGKMLKIYPIVSQFNHTMIVAMLDEKPTIIDLSNPLRPIGYPAVNHLNHIGFMLKKDDPKWINISAPKGKEVKMATLKMDETGTLIGDIKVNSIGYHAIAEREAMAESKDGAFWEKRISERFPDASVNSVTFGEEKDNIYKPLKATINCTLAGAAQATGDFIYLSPALFPAFSENPFKFGKRTYPVDFPYPISEQLVVNLEIPAGYAIEEIPEQLSIVLPEKAASFKYLLSQNGNTIQLVSKITINKLQYSPEEYQEIKNFFSLIIEKQGEQIVLKKKA